MNYKYEVAIVLAGGVNPNKALPPIPKARVDMGISLFKDRKVPYLIFSGHFSFFSSNHLSLSESQAMKDYAISQGVPTDRIISEDESKDTLGNAYFTKVKIVVPKGWKKLVII